jgi:hypothetical protein
MLLHTESAARYIHDMRVKLEYYYICKGSWRNRNHSICHKPESLMNISKYEADVEQSLLLNTLLKTRMSVKLHASRVASN